MLADSAHSRQRQHRRLGTIGRRWEPVAPYEKRVNIWHGLADGSRRAGGVRVREKRHSWEERDSVARAVPVNVGHEFEYTVVLRDAAALELDL